MLKLDSIQRETQKAQPNKPNTHHQPHKTESASKISIRRIEIPLISIHSLGIPIRRIA